MADETYDRPINQEEARHRERAMAAEIEARERETDRAIAAAESWGMRFRRISWGAVFAGVVVALVVHLMLSILGIAIGATAFDPTQPNPWAGLGIGTAIWFIISSLIALFVGGWVAARLSGVARRGDAALHGIVTWGLATLVSAYLLTTAVGGLIGGTVGILGGTIQGAVASGGMPSRQQLKDVTQAGSPAREAAIQAIMSQRNVDRAKAEAILDQNIAQATQAAETASEKLGQAAFWTFIGLLVAALAAAFGGWMGRQRETVLLPA